MKIPFKIVLTLVILVGLERFTRLQTHGFRLSKTTIDFPTFANWEVGQVQDLPKVLQQPFYFLDSGVQCYVFLSEDQTTVLKLFKHYHAGLSSKQLRNLPLPPFLDPIRNNILEKRQKRIDHIFSSALLAYRNLRDQTGVFHINLNKHTGKYRKLTIYDKIGIRYQIDLNQTPFLLQKKADRIYPYLQKHPDQTPHVIDSLLHCIQNRNDLGIANSDPAIDTNFGVLDGKVIELDVGSFYRNPSMKNPLQSNREILQETLELKEWLKRHTPQMHAYLEEKLLQVTQT